MHITSRSYLTTGIATLGVGALALAPVQPIPHQLDLAPQRVISSLAVELAATVNPFQAWADAFTTTVNNGLTLAQYYLKEPFPLLTTWTANQVTYLQELFSGNADQIFPQIQNNLKTLFEAPLDPGPTVTLPNDFSDPVTSVTWPTAVPGNPGNFSDGCSGTPGGTGDNCGQAPSGVNLLLLQLVAGASQTEPDPTDFPNWDTFVGISPFYNFAASFASGLLMGALGTVLSPLVSLSNSFTAFGENLKAGKVLDAIYDIVNIPANMTNAFFNGAGYFELNPLLKAFGIDLNGGDVPFGSVGLNLGGLLNLTPVDDPITQYNGGIAADALGGPVTGDTKVSFLGAQGFWGVRVGLGGSLVHMGQFLGEKLRVTPPAPTAAVAPAAAVAAASAAPAAPAPVDFEVAADDPAPADDADARADAGAAVVSEALEVEAPADFAEIAEVTEAAEVAEDSAPAPAAAVGSDDAGDTGSRASGARRGAANAD